MTPWATSWSSTATATRWAGSRSPSTPGIGVWIAVAVHEGHVAFGVVDRVVLYRWDGEGVPGHVATSEPLPDVIRHLRWDGEGWLVAPITGRPVRVALDGTFPTRGRKAAASTHDTLREKLATFEVTCSAHEDYGAADTEVGEQLAQAALDVLADPNGAIVLPEWMCAAGVDVVREGAEAGLPRARSGR